MRRDPARRTVVATLCSILLSTALALPQAGAAASDQRSYASQGLLIPLSNAGFGFGYQGLGAGDPEDGRLWWRMVDGAPSPLLTGTLHMKGVAGSCARMRIDYLSSGGLSLATRYGGEVCASSDRHQRYGVSLQPYTSSKIGRVRVTVQQRPAATATWTAAGSKTADFPSLPATVKITGDGLDFGGEGFLGSAPTGSGTLTWSYETGRVHARLRGILHLNNVAGACARMKVEHVAAAGALLGSDAGETVCAPDNRHRRWRIDLGSFSHRDTVKARVRLQQRGSDHVWRNVGTSLVWFSVSTSGKTRLASG